MKTRSIVITAALCLLALTFSFAEDVNLGTWTERCFDASSPPDLSLPILRLDDEEGRLRASLVDLADESRELQRFESA